MMLSQCTRAVAAVACDGWEASGSLRLSSRAWSSAAGSMAPRVSRKADRWSNEAGSSGTGNIMRVDILRARPCSREYPFVPAALVLRANAEGKFQTTSFRCTWNAHMEVNPRRPTTARLSGRRMRGIAILIAIGWGARISGRQALTLTV